MEGSIWLWVGFNAFVLMLLALDLGVFHRKAHAVSIKEAGVWSVVWILLAMLFNGAIYLFWDRAIPGSSYSNGEAALSFLTGYLIEKSLSVDNIFVFVLIFSSFAVPALYQHRVLFWGIVGALLLRAAMIIGGAALLKQFHWLIYVFGGFLIFTGIRMALHKGEGGNPAESALVRFIRRFVPVSDTYHGEKFFTRISGKWMVTPLFLVLLVVETTDVVFAVDSIPAIFAVTKEPFIVYTSNVFAILGLRSLYFVLAGMADKFRYLKPALSVILVFVGAKMLLAEVYKIEPVISLLVIASILTVAIVLSITTKPKPKQTSVAHH